LSQGVCRGCHGDSVQTVVDLGPVPASDIFPSLDAPLPDPSWPLALALCSHCHLVQLGPTDAAAPAPPSAVESATSLEFHHLLPLVQQSQIDTIRHGHWVYLSALALDSLVSSVGLTLTRAVSTTSFGGSLRLTAGRAADGPKVDDSVGRVLDAEREAGLGDPASLAGLGERGRSAARELRRRMEGFVADGLQVAGYGAPSKAPVLLALAGVDVSLLPYTVDMSSAKHGCRIPGADVPILSVDTLLQRRPDVVVVLTWDIADEVVAQLSGLAGDWDPVVFVPMPQPRSLRLLRDGVESPAVR
jgi:hypothetical protein